MFSSTILYQFKHHHRSLKTSTKPTSLKLKHPAPASILIKKTPSQSEPSILTKTAPKQSQSSPPPKAPDSKPVEGFAEGEWIPPGLRGRAPPTIDIKSPRYKSAARRVTLIMISLPIFIVTSYHLAMRTWFGAEQKTFERKEEVDFATQIWGGARVKTSKTKEELGDDA